PVERRSVQDERGGGDGGEGPLRRREPGGEEEAGDAEDDEDRIVQDQQPGGGQDAGEVGGGHGPPAAHRGRQEGVGAEDPGQSQGGERERADRLSVGGGQVDDEGERQGEVGGGLDDAFEAPFPGGGREGVVHPGPRESVGAGEDEPRRMGIRMAYPYMSSPVAIMKMMVGHCQIGGRWRARNHTGSAMPRIFMTIGTSPWGNSGSQARL